MILGEAPVHFLPKLSVSQMQNIRSLSAIGLLSGGIVTQQASSAPTVGWCRLMGDLKGKHQYM